MSLAYVHAAYAYYAYVQACLRVYNALEYTWSSEVTLGITCISFLTRYSRQQLHSTLPVKKTHIPVARL